MGLGLLGGGIAATKWLVKHGAKVTVTDLKSRADLVGSIKALGTAAKRVKFVLGKHNESDFKSHDIVVVNPAVPKESKYLKIALDSGAQLENEATLFFKFCQNPIIAVTGTRGKTTTANWIFHFLKAEYGNKAMLSGNSPEHPFLKELDRLDGKSPVVVEISSWHLEFFARPLPPPHIAIITNLYPDHLNRHPDMNDYASAKANIFKNQTQSDFLILNHKNEWTKFFIKRNPKSKILYSDNIEKYHSERLMEMTKNLVERTPCGPRRSDIFPRELGDHNRENLMTAALAANLAGVGWDLIKKAVKTLPKIKFREEIIYQKAGLTIVNDATATSPDATIAALTRFTNHSHKGQTLILAAGGTDKKLDYAAWARAVKKFIKPQNLFLLDGSATVKMINALENIKYFGKIKPQMYLSLEILLTSALNRITMAKGRKLLLFSPAAASFEKFKNEFDRGEQVNRFFKQKL